MTLREWIWGIRTVLTLLLLSSFHLCLLLTESNQPFGHKIYEGLKGIWRCKQKIPSTHPNPRHSLLTAPNCSQGFLTCPYCHLRSRWRNLFFFFFVKEYLNYRTIALISHVSKVMLKILQTRLQQYMNRELPDVQVDFRKGRGTRDQIANIHWIINKARYFWKSIYFFFIGDAKAFGCVHHNELWKILQEMGIPDHLTWLLRNLYAGQDATVRIGHGTTDWFQIGKGVCQHCI